MTSSRHDDPARPRPKLRLIHCEPQLPEPRLAPTDETPVPPVAPTDEPLTPPLAPTDEPQPPSESLASTGAPAPPRPVARTGERQRPTSFVAGEPNGASAPRLTERDRSLLAFMAEHRIVRADHVQRFLGSSLSTAQRRLRALRLGGFVRRDFVFDHQPACLQITRDGLAAISSRLPVPKRDLSAFSHDVGLTWLWLAARDGAFGDLREIVAERRLRSRDTPARRAQPSLAVRMGGVGPGGRERLHYPDLLLITAGGRRVAVELELTAKTRTRREEILSAYGADPRIDAVVYLVADKRVGNPVITAVRRLGISQLVDVQTVKLAGAEISPPDGPAAQRSLTSSRPEGFER